jgi:uncharacterized protein (DUF1800 family)
MNAKLISNAGLVDIVLAKARLANTTSTNTTSTNTTLHHASPARRQALNWGAKIALGFSGISAAKANDRLTLPIAARQMSGEQIAAHLLNRLGYGPRPGDIAAVASNPLAWLQTQLGPRALALPVTLTARLDESAFLNRHPVQLVQEFRGLIRAQSEAAPLANGFKSDGVKFDGVQSGAVQVGGEMAASAPAFNQTASPLGGTGPAEQSQNQGHNLGQNPASPQPATPLVRFVGSVARPAVESRILRALESPRQLEEVMVDFWFNHFNVFQGKNILRVLVGHYEHYAIRPFAMGRFRDLLGATARHPAMLYYLDNALSVAQGTPGGGGNRGLNENFARELMELHTLGVDGGYRQKDVTELARMLTGWTIQPQNRVSNLDARIAPGVIEQMPGFWFNERVHDQGEKDWLGHRVAAQGQKEGEFALDVLAKHPSTAKHIAFKLAQYFVNDQPSAALVGKLAEVFLEGDGAIVPVLTALFHHEAFWAKENVASKFKTPYHYVLSTVRALGSTPGNLQAVSAAMATQGMPLYGCVTPDGYRNTEAAWLNADGMTKRINFATNLTSARMGVNLPVEALISQLGPLVSEPTRAVARESAKDPPLASALVLAGPAMMRR